MSLVKIRTISSFLSLGLISVSTHISVSLHNITCSIIFLKFIREKFDRRESSFVRMNIASGSDFYQ